MLTLMLRSLYTWLIGQPLQLCGGQAQRQRAWERRIDAPLRPLSPSRSRRLTYSQYKHDQEQSALISRLPAEIRVLIWAHVVGREDGTDVLHIEMADGILRYNHCYQREVDLPGFQHECWTQPFTKSHRVLGIRGNQQPDGHCRRAILPLLFTCKLIYSESIDLLYSANIFDFRRTDALIRLPRIMLPNCLQDIRRLQFSTAFACYPSRYDGRGTLRADYWRLPDDSRKWPAACEVLASLPHLQYARVTIVVLCRKSRYCRTGANASLLYEILEPLQDVNAPEFTVEITERLQEMRERLGETPFRLIEREIPDFDRV